MGKASRRKEDARALREFESAVARVASAIRRHAIACSGQLGVDCAMHAQMGRVLLAELGFDARPVLGYAAWRVGPGGGDVITHRPVPHAPEQPGGHQYHVWLEWQDLLIDFTTYQFTWKAQQLDALDGQHTTVSWCPEFLILRRKAVRSHGVVAQALLPGVAYYEARPDLDPALARYVPDPRDIAIARVILKNPQAKVFGAFHPPGGRSEPRDARSSPPVRLPTPLGDLGRCFPPGRPLR